MSDLPLKVDHPSFLNEVVCAAHGCLCTYDHDRGVATKGDFFQCPICEFVKEEKEKKASG